MKVVIVIPAYNEASVIQRVIDEVCALYEHVVVVDDASIDDTFQRASQTRAVVLRHAINRGQGAALMTGLTFALMRGADVLVTFDADGQHAVGDIARLIAPIERGEVDVVLGSRFLNSSNTIPPIRRFILQCGVLFTRAISHIRITDTHNGLRAFSRRAAQTIRIIQDRYTHASEILDEIIRHRLRYTEVPVTIHYSDYSRRKGQSNTALLHIAMRFILHKLRQ